MANEALQEDLLDKRHTLLSQLTPALELKILGNYALTIPFHYITKFEMNVKEMQVHLELFDSSFYLIDTFAFVLAQMSKKGIPVKVKFGYAKTSSVPTYTNDRVQMADQAFYLSKEYDMVVLSVESRPEEKGTSITIMFVVNVVDPVLTAVPVKKIFVSGDTASYSANAQLIQDSIIDKWNSGSEDDKKKATQATKVLEEMKKRQGFTSAALQESLRTQYGPDVEIVNGKLTFTEIYTRLMNEAFKYQNKLGFQRRGNWEIPLAVMPEEFDNNYDFVHFNCNSDNIYTNLQRLASMMTGKSTQGTSGEKNFNATASNVTNPPAQNNTTQPKPRFRMIGGTFTFHNAKVDKKITGASLYDDKGQKTQFEATSASKKAFCVWAFNEAPYEVRVEQEPVAFYRYHAGDPEKFDPNNLTEVISFSAEFNNASQYFMSSTGFGLNSVQNTATGVTTDTSQNDAASAQDRLASQSVVNQNLSQQSSSQKNSNPAEDPNGSVNSNVSASADQSAMKQFQVPASIDPTRDAQTLKDFSDAIRSQVRDYMKVFSANLTILGDPKFDALFMTFNRTIYFEFVNKVGDTNPIYSGHYIIKNIRHIIENGKYVTELELQAIPESNIKAQPENATVNATNVQGFSSATSTGEAIKNAQVTISVIRSGNSWKVTNVGAYSAEGYKDSQRVSEILSKDPNNRNRLRDEADKLVKPINSNKFEDVVRETRGKLITEMVVSQTIQGIGDKSLPVKFIIFEVVQA